jgi:hypothetical protein
MIEAVEAKASLIDVSEDTFERFCQFAYTGDYITPEHRFVLISPSDETSKDIETPSQPDVELDSSNKVEPEDEWTLPAQSSKKLKKPSKSQLMRQAFEDISYEAGKFHEGLHQRCAVRENSSASEDYTPVFLGHARVYVFADKWGVADLKKLTLFKLHQTLRSFTLYAARRPDIVELIRFAYDNTPDHAEYADGLRTLLTHYVGCEIESLKHCPEFISLITEGGDITRDIFQIILKRIK